MFLKKDILDFLHKDRIKNINIINFIENNPIHYMEKVGDSVIVKGRSDEDWVYISSSSEKELKTLLEKCKEDDFFVVMDDWILPFMINDSEIEWKLSCIKLIFPEDIQLSDCKYEIRELTADDAQYIYHNSKYKDYTSTQYITDRIQKGIALGIYDEEKLAAWIMTHDDGAIGFLNVIPEYRKRGYGYGLTIGIIDRLRKLNKIPFVHIEEDNYKSMSLALKTGFTKDRNIHWIKRKNKI